MLKLLKNPDYLKLAGTAALLQDMVKNVTWVQNSSKSVTTALLPEPVIKRANDIAKLAKDTTVVTYCP